jgi:hypothetical protein
MVYSMPAQPPFFTPTRSPAIGIGAPGQFRKPRGGPVNFMTCGRGRGSAWRPG